MATTLDVSTPTQSRTATAARAQALAWTFAGTILLSAFLLFQIQPLISKAILPWFGGSPAVWTTCMLFFQVLLFFGYAYAHAVTRWLPLRGQLVLHLLLLTAAIALLPILPSAAWKPLDGGQPTWRILALLSVAVGLPYFLLSTTGPLVQAWFARTYAGQSPYRLYALSNIGSLAALMTFPFVFEPQFDLTALDWMWSAGFVAFASLCAISVWNTVQRAASSPNESAAVKQRDLTAARPQAWQRVLWVALPAWASMMLLAVTNYVCQDVAVIPLLWVVPLSVYLLSFIISFDQPRWYSRAWYAAAGVLLLLAIASMHEWPTWAGALGVNSDLVDLGFTTELVLYFAALFVVCMLCHGELAGVKPHPKHLTEYFLMMSAGGALGGLFVSIIAPRVFTTFYEWNIGLVGSFALACILAALALDRRLAAPDRQLRIANLATCAVLALPGSYLIADWQASSSEPVYQSRSFYGVVSVREFYEGTADHHLAFVSGSVKHGRQYADPAKRRIPLAYYGPHTGAGRAIQFFRDKPSARVGVVGMGIGVLATYAEPEDSYRFYEINPDVVHLANEHFTFLKDCRGECEVVLGDARLQLERELENGSHHFDVLVLDAFSGDAVPSHLLTDEAFQIYEQHLADGGVLAFHVTNRYLNLAPVVEGLAEEHGFQTTRICTPYDGDRLLYRTDYILVTRNANFLAAHPPQVPEELVSTAKVPLWTDRYNNIFSLLKQ